ncbi:PREDICTED: cold and drought-regulated protein CORA-like [Ipomoea nil]|uniref:cold and drought-regulated protein CORA-like n=1 Tax=Ipomoea nil TaxID=35883 RepID=UPI000901AF4C|nr:PREDICTED: cold and drought-regulated protein CORA-like [Ipomoea nil]
MGSKVFVLLGLSLTVFLLIASEVTAETTTTSVEPTKAEKASGVAGFGRGWENGYGHGGHGGGGYGHGGHGGGGYGHGGHGGGFQGIITKQKHN